MLAELRSYSIPILSFAPLFPLFRPRNELIEQDGLPVDTTATDVDGDVSESPHPPFFVCVSDQHLGLHLLAVVVVGAAAPLPGVVAQDLRYRLCRNISI